MNNANKNTTRYTALGFISGFITVLALAFHFPIQIVNALDYQTVEGFDIHVSIWRILFEPFLGPLLFYLRADQPIDAYFWLLIWAVIISGLLFLYKFYNNKITFKKGIVNWLARIPLLISIWLGLFVMMIFMPLPSNIIVNNTDDLILMNTHAHTEHSHDGLISQNAQMKWHKRNGFDAFFITDHNNHAKTLEAVAKQSAGTLSADPLIITGQEFSGSNHLILLGLTEDFKTKGLPDSIVINKVQEQNGVVIVAHWFDGKGKHSIQHYIDIGADGFEIANQADGLTYDRNIFKSIVEKCEANNLLMLGVCDYHGYGSTAFAWNALQIPNWDQLDHAQKTASVMDILRKHQQEKVTVLLYHDRKVRPADKKFFSPFYLIPAYFRTLNFAQVLSWLIWSSLFLLLLPYLFPKGGYIPSIKLLGLISAGFILTHGIILKVKANRITGENDIYAEYSQLLLIAGGVLLVYSLVVFVIKFRVR